VLSAAGAAATLYGGYQAIKAVAGGGGSGGMPPLPPAMGSTGSFGLPRGPGGGVQAPWNDPSTPTGAKPFALDDSALRMCYKAPKGYVVMWDGGRRGLGRPFPVLKSWASKNRYADGTRIFTPGKKPPISVGDWSALKKANRVVHKIKMVNKMAMHVANFGSHRRAAPRLQVIEAPGRKLIGRKAA
jgi:hypothetical protein